MTTLVLLAYGALGYWHFRATLRALQPYDTPDTAILNSILALLVGPPLLVSAILFDLSYRIYNELRSRSPNDGRL